MSVTGPHLITCVCAGCRANNDAVLDMYRQQRADAELHIRGLDAAIAAATPEPSAAAQPSEPMYPCDDCGKLRTEAQGGTTFTVCDECWERRAAERASAAPEGEGASGAGVEDELRQAIALFRSPSTLELGVAVLRPIAGDIEEALTVLASLRADRDRLERELEEARSTIRRARNYLKGRVQRCCGWIDAIDGHDDPCPGCEHDLIEYRALHAPESEDGDA